MEDVRIEINILPRDMHFSKEKKIWSVAEDHWSLVSGECISSELLTYDEAVNLCYKVFTLLDTKTFIVFVDNNTRIELGEKAEYDNLLISSPVENRDAPRFEKIWAVVNVDKNVEISDKKVTKAEANNICIDSFNRREGNSFLIYVPDAKYKK